MLAILPTCSAKVNGINIRCLKDTGCQKCFISKKIVKRANLKVGQKVELTVSGFNSAKTYHTYETVVPLEFGNRIFYLDTIVLPNVSTRFAADGLSALAAGFVAKGYRLADHALLNDRNEVDSLDMVLGISATNVFLKKVRTYGENNENMFLETIGGIMPIGHSLQAYAGLKYLPHADKNPHVHSTARLSNEKKITKNENITKVESVAKNEKSESKGEMNENKNVNLKRPVNSNKVTKSKKFGHNQQPKSLQKPETKKPSVKKPTQTKKANSSKQPISKVDMNKKQISSSISVATPATIEVATASENISKPQKQKTAKSSESAKIANKFLSNLLGYSKQEVFGVFSGFGASTEIDLDNLLGETLGYDNYEKSEQYTDLDAQIVDFVYKET